MFFLNAEYNQIGLYDGSYLVSFNETHRSMSSKIALNLNIYFTSILTSYLPNFRFIIGGLGTEEGHGGLLLPHLLAAHAAPLCLPDLGARHLDIAGAAARAGK